MKKKNKKIDLDVQIKTWVGSAVVLAFAVAGGLMVSSIMQQRIFEGEMERIKAEQKLQAAGLQKNCLKSRRQADSGNYEEPVVIGEIPTSYEMPDSDPAYRPAADNLDGTDFMVE